MVVALGQQYDVGEKPTLILYTCISRHAGTPNITKINKNIVVHTKSKPTKNNAVHDWIG